MPKRSTGNASERPYQYERLHIRTGEIRLIKITNVREDADKDSIVLELDIARTRLDRAGPYIAISYAWGNPAPTHKLLVNGAALFVPENTFRTLYTVYHALPTCAPNAYARGELVPLWIDAICINQSDNKEKDDQVRRMGQIYSQAARTIGYIGRPPQGHSPFHAFRTLLWLANDVGLTINDVPDDAPHAWFRESACDPGRFEEEVGPVEEFAEAYRDLFLSDWFGRCWVVQEMVLSQEAICLYGYGSDVAAMSLNNLTTLLDQYYSLSNERHRAVIFNAIILDTETTCNLDENEMQVLYWKRIRENARQGNSERHGLLQLLKMARFGKVTDPRDKVYSLMGLMTKKDRAAIRVDYSNDHTAADLLLNVAIHCLGSPDGHQVLGWAGLRRNRVFSKLPSWVPDWSAPATYFVPVPTGLFTASGNLSHPLIVLDGDRRISSAGIPVDTITCLTPQMAYSGTPDRANPFWVLHYAAQLCLRLQRDAIATGSLAADTYQFTNEPWHEVIRRTCCMDRQSWPYYGRAGPDNIPQFEACLEKLGFGADAVATVALDEATGKVAMEGLEMVLDETRMEAALQFEDTVYMAQAEMVFGTTGENGFIGSFPEATRVGDIVVVILGMQVPVVLRPLSDAEEGFQLVGPCYVHGIMDGEWIRHVEDAAGVERGGGSEISREYVIH